MNCTKCNTPGAPCEMINGLCHRCTAARLNEANTQLTAWHESFGTTQLTHAISRLEAAERERDQLKAQLESAQKAGAEMRTVLEVAQRNWAHGKVWLMDASALNHALSSDCGKAYHRVQYVSAVSGLLYDNPDAAGDVSAIIIDGKQIALLGGKDYVRRDELQPTIVLLNHIRTNHTLDCGCMVCAELTRLQALHETTP